MPKRNPGKYIIAKHLYIMPLQSGIRTAAEDRMHVNGLRSVRLRTPKTAARMNAAPDIFSRDAGLHIVSNTGIFVNDYQEKLPACKKILISDINKYLCHIVSVDEKCPYHTCYSSCEPCGA